MTKGLEPPVSEGAPEPLRGAVLKADEVDGPHGENDPIELGAFEMGEVAKTVAVEEES